MEACLFYLQDNLKFININQEYLKYLHDASSEVYFKSKNYDTKPYLCILVTNQNQKYVIPLSTAKAKHKYWKNIEADRFLIYETCEKSKLNEKDIFIENEDGTAKHILSVIDLKKIATGKIIPFCCDFKLLEEKCREFVLYNDIK